MGRGPQPRPLRPAPPGRGTLEERVRPVREREQLRHERFEREHRGSAVEDRSANDAIGSERLARASSSIPRPERSCGDSNRTDTGRDGDRRRLGPETWKLRDFDLDIML
jgi:hypothetical protein